MAPAEWAAWLALLQLHRTVLAELDTTLRRQHGLAVTEFDVLITLFNAAAAIAAGSGVTAGRQARRVWHIWRRGR